ILAGGAIQPAGPGCHPLQPLHRTRPGRLIYGGFNSSWEVRMSKWMRILGVCLGLGLSLMLVCSEAAEGAGKPRSRRLVKPWSELTSLTEEQKTQIVDIH